MNNIELVNSLSEDDFLTYQLYAASKSNQIKKSRKIGRILIPLMYFVVFILFIITTRYTLGIIILSIGILWFLIYPIYSKKRYLNYYKKFIQENYKNRIGIEGLISIENGFIITKDQTGDGKIKLSEVDAIVEIDTHIFIHLKQNISMIFKKNNDKNDLINQFVKIIETENNIEKTIELNWKWN